mgnify:FL=1
MSWQQAKPTTHDHVGFMRYGETCAWCVECDQRWKLGRMSWVPIADNEADPHELYVMRADELSHAHE